ncbi:kinesin-like protein KIF15 isoform X3 [Hydractinia symbiolongicarpus]|uniref:kinesin-like protein KIF15 isoform X3 n=1 Tax=Hydractinia symbiolongicarpus TaxID=13093 RepID=UPI00254C75E2|nr:kinesin-like protein KIF15 isoform X3 [Hydractinia symbiolongicarpus]
MPIGEQRARALSTSLNAGVRGGSLSSRIPRFSRRASAADVSLQNDSINSSFESVLNTSYESGILTINERGLKRHHSIYERGERSKREDVSISQTLYQQSQLSPRRAKSPTSTRKGLNPAAVKRHKSFSAGERSLLKRPLTVKPLLTMPLAEPPRSSSSPTPSPSGRRGTIHTLDVARTEGIVSMKPTTKTTAVSDPGRVQVFVRIRPPNETEDLSKHPIAVTVADEENTQLQLFDGKNKRCYQFDGVLSDTTDNKEVFKTVGEPLVYSALSGFNGILMCYGQTGTGKTYTLMSNDGMSVRIIYQCFKVVNADIKHKYTVTCSYLQIYQEKLYDLLNETRTVELSLREHPKTGVYIENLTEYVVHSPKEVLNLLKVGKRRLVFAETKMNRASSRSHAICQLKILKERVGADNTSQRNSPCYGIKTPDFSDEEEYYDSHDQLGHSIDASYQSLIDDNDDEDVLSNVTQLEDGVTSVRGKIYICDLAGSERIKKTKASGERLQEAQHINSSLLELGNVIQALADGNRSHVPFRNSTLTRLLQEGLSGNCKTRLVVCCAPTVRDVHETKCSLNFGSRAMKIQVMAHVNYEVDYKKLAEALAAKLETLEQDWDIQKKDYEKFIKQLKSELENRRLASPMESLLAGSKSSLKQVQSLLIIELMTLQLFYNLQENAEKQTESPNVFVLTTANQELMLQSVEGLLELLSDYMHEQPSSRAKNYSNMSSSGNSSVITSPDYIEQTGLSGYDVPSKLEPVARFLEHAQITTANVKNKLRKLTQCSEDEQGSNERFRGVMNCLVRLKDTINQNAVSCLKTTFKKELDDDPKGSQDLSSLQNIIKRLNENKELSNFDSFDDAQALESSLYYVLMDKGLLSCMILLKIQTASLYQACTSQSPSVETCSPDVKRVLKELATERSERDKLQDTVYSLREEKVICDENLKDIELELKTVRELKDNLETKLHAVENKNVKYEEQITKARAEQCDLEKRLADIEARKDELESSLKNSDNNNARKERLIVDLKNEKVALDSLVSTLKEEITLLEKERTRDVEEKRQIEEELEDVRDRNIILETEWSCCREENGLLENELTALEEDKTILEVELLKYRDDVKMLEEAVSMLEAQSKDYKQDIVSLKTKEERLLASVRVEKEKFNKEVNTLRQEMSTLRVERRRFQRDISISRSDKSNTERAYNALKIQKDSLQDDLSSYKQEEKRLQREIMLLKSDRTKLEREVNSLKNDNIKLKQQIAQADKVKMNFKLLQKNEEKILSMFNLEKDKLIESLCAFKEKYNRMEQDFSKICAEKEKLSKQLKRYEESTSSASTVRRSQSQPTSDMKVLTPEKRLKASSSVQGALVRRSVHSGEVSEVEGKVLDLQRRLAFFMAEKEDTQKEIITTRERNAKLTSEIKCLEDDTAKIQVLLSTLTKEKELLASELSQNTTSRQLLIKERDELKQVVDSAQEVTTQLRNQLDKVSEQNRILEVDQMTIKESVKLLQSESVVLAAENQHIKTEFETVDRELTATRSVVQNLNSKLGEMNKKLKEAGEKENTLIKQVSLLENENLSLVGQVGACQQEEELLVHQLRGLNLQFNHLEATLENVVSYENQVSSNESQTEDVKNKNTALEQTVKDLKTQLVVLEFDASKLKKKREEIEALLQNSNKEKATLVTNIELLKTEVVKLKNEKVDIEKKIALLEEELKVMGRENILLNQHIMEKSNRLHQERSNYKEHIDRLQEQIEDLVKERIHLEAELGFLKKQNEQLRQEIVIILEDNDNLEHELGGLEDVFGRQEKELGSATEETKALLRQLCAVEAENLNLCTQQSLRHDDVEDFKKQIDRLEREKEKIGIEKMSTEVKTKTLKERLLMAELEISKLKSEHATVESQRRLLVEDLDAADRERNLLKSELHGLARALSPLKKDVSDVLRKQESLQSELNQSSNIDISNELLRIKEDLCSFNAEKAALECEQCDLESRLRTLSEEKEGLRGKLRNLIQDLNNRSQEGTHNDLTEMEETIQLISQLITKKDDLNEDKILLTEDLLDAQYTNQVLNVSLSTCSDRLRSTQEELGIATVERLKLKDKARQVDRRVSEIQKLQFDCKSGVSPLQYELNKLKTDISNFEVEQLNVLEEVQNLNKQLELAENNLINVVYFKKVIEKNLRQYKERNNQLELHLRVIYDDLVGMEAHMETAPSKSAKVLLETLDLHKHFQSLEDDLRTTESHNVALKEDAANLLERCAALEEEKNINTVSSGYLQDSMDGQHSLIAQLQKEKDALAYEKSRLLTKLSFYKDDKKRILEDSQRLNKNLAAYARYTQQLEKKLQVLKIDLSDLKNSPECVSMSAAFSSTNLKEASGMLCDRCIVNVRRKFEGVHVNTQLLGDELLDCITDNLSLETAIFSFMEEKLKLEREMVVVETDFCDLGQQALLNELSSQHLSG